MTGRTDARRQPMEAAVTDTHRDRFLVAVTHDADQSYSRAVQPRAMREAHRHLRAVVPGGNWVLVDVDYGPDHDSWRCTTTYMFERRP